MPSLAWIFLVFAAVLVVTACGLSVKSVGNIEFHSRELSSPVAALVGAAVLGAAGLLLPLDHGGRALLPVFVSGARGDVGPSGTTTPSTSSDPAAGSGPGAVATAPTIIPPDTFGGFRFPRSDLEATVSPTSGRIGDSVTITGNGCQPGEKVEIDGIGPQLLAVVRADSAGAFRATFVVPDWRIEGLQQIQFRCVSSQSRGSGEFTLR